MTHAITLRLDDADHGALRARAERLGVRPGTLARMLVHAGLRDGGADPARSEARSALDRLVGRSVRHPSADAVSLVHDGRAELDPAG